MGARTHTHTHTEERRRSDVAAISKVIEFVTFVPITSVFDKTVLQCVYLCVCVCVPINKLFFSLMCFQEG